MENMSEKFTPYIPAEQEMAEFTFRAVMLGAILGLVFSAVTVYLGLKAGLTVAVNIPIAIIGIALFSGFRKKVTVLELTTVQTTGAAGGSIASGIIFTLPALIFLGFTLDLTKAFVVALAGGLLGICFLIPLRKYLIEREHGVLPYPEGIACAEVIKSKDKGGVHARSVFWGAGFGIIYKGLMAIGRFWKEIPIWNPSFYRGSTLAGEVSPELLGVGYLIGPRVAGIMVAGGFISWMLLIPLIRFFGAAIPVEISSGGAVITKTVGEITNYSVLWNKYVRYIGAGAVVAGGVINLFKALPTIIHSFRESFAEMRTPEAAASSTSRISRDLPISFVAGGIGLAFVVIFLLLTLIIHPGHIFGNFLASILIIVFGFFFATVSARLVGEIGVSSNPTSGMTIATLMITSLIFLAVGWAGGIYTAVVLMVGAVVCICASNAGNVSQALKTGYLIGCTPRKQEYGYTIGAFAAIFLVGATLIVLNNAFTVEETITDPSFTIPEQAVSEKVIEHKGGQYQVYGMPGTGEKFLVDQDNPRHIIRREAGIGSSKLPAPQARLMATVIDGVLNRRLPWVLVLMGICLTIGMELCGVSTLPFAVGVYLPLWITTPIFTGGIIRWGVEKFSRTGNASDKSGTGMLFGSGLIAGGALGGLLYAILVAFGVDSFLAVGPRILGSLTEKSWFSMIFFAIMCIMLIRTAVRKTES
ncbi:MAG: oligopeptide transporter, OPT family [Candidatus Latescibacteria bacterium]|nr:oligopeptide transporter, OPT family [bacterium]MBD3424935.1 oligopeptide transporter, OPT family [Candidatus Latescibacterota bacterium]